MMAEYKVVWEIEVEADSPLEAAKSAQELMLDPQYPWAYYVQHNDEDVFSIDLSEKDKDAVLNVKHTYIPLIK